MLRTGGKEPEDGMDVNTTPELFSSPTLSPTYTQVATGTVCDELPEANTMPATATTQPNTWDFLAPPRATKSGRKQDPPPPPAAMMSRAPPKTH